MPRRNRPVPGWLTEVHAYCVSLTATWLVLGWYQARSTPLPDWRCSVSLAIGAVVIRIGLEPLWRCLSRRRTVKRPATLSKRHR